MHSKDDIAEAVHVSQDFNFKTLYFCASRAYHLLLANLNEFGNITSYFLVSPPEDDISFTPSLL